MDVADPNRAVERREMLEPHLAKCKMEQVPSIRARDRSERDEPNATQQSPDTLPPNFKFERSETPLPRWKKSKALNVDPNLAECRKDMLEEMSVLIITLSR
jgi:hypothetical protein